MKEKLSIEYVSNLFSALHKLQSEIYKTKEDFFSAIENEKKRLYSQSIYDINGSILPNSIGFDINKFLDVFDKIKLKDGFVLDYAYLAGGGGGEPLVYTRHINAPKLSANGYLSKYDNVFENESYHGKKPYLDDIILDNSPESLYQLAVFSKVVHQFYQFWHAAYNDQTFVISIESLDTILREIEISDKDIETLKQLSFEPEIEITKYGGKVRYILFSKWEGFYYETMSIESSLSWPKIQLDITEKTPIVEYHCGILY